MSNLFLFYVHWCFTRMYVWVKVSGTLKLVFAAMWLLAVELRFSGSTASTL